MDKSLEVEYGTELLISKAVIFLSKYNNCRKPMQALAFI